MRISHKCCPCLLYKTHHGFILWTWPTRQRKSILSMSVEKRDRYVVGQVWHELNEVWPSLTVKIVIVHSFQKDGVLFERRILEIKTSRWLNNKWIERKKIIGTNVDNYVLVIFGCLWLSEHCWLNISSSSSRSHLDYSDILETKWLRREVPNLSVMKKC